MPNEFKGLVNDVINGLSSIEDRLQDAFEYRAQMWRDDADLRLRLDKEVQDAYLTEIKDQNEKLFESRKKAAEKLARIEIEQENFRYTEALKAAKNLTEDELAKEQEKHDQIIKNIKEEANLKIAENTRTNKQLLEDAKILYDQQVDAYFKTRDAIKKDQAKAKEAAKKATQYETDQKFKDAARKSPKSATAKQTILSGLGIVQSTSDQLDSIEAYEKDKNAVGGALFGKGKSLGERFSTIRDTFKNDDGQTDIGKGLSALAGALSDFTKQLDSTITNIADSQQKIDTRLQGMNVSWRDMSTDIKNSMGASPFVKQEDVVNNLKTMISKGIAFNVEQRAFLETVKVGIADTFDANNSALTRLIRLQQEDSTAARLGMESAMTAFLNDMYQTSEYMSSIMQSMKDQLVEAESLMGKEDAVAFEYQVQKWLGSMYSVGVSNQSVSSIGNAIGKLAAGQLEGITNGGTGNLIAIAANYAGISLADALKDGLDESNTNRLMRAMVEYLSGIYEESKDNKVVQQQFAQVFGLTASDLKALKNLSTSDITNTFNSNVNYNQALGRLNSMGTSYGSRMSLGQKLENSYSNFKYTLASGIASNPALYSIYKVAGALDNVAGGLEFSLPLVLGSGTAQTFNTADIMRTGALSASLVTGISSIVSSLGDAISGKGITGMLNKFGAFNNTSVVKGTGNGLFSTTMDTSESGYVGNGGGDIYDQTVSGVADEQKQKLAEAKKDQEDEVTIKTVDEHLVQISQLLTDVANGTRSLSVSLDQTSTNAWSEALAMAMIRT